MKKLHNVLIKAFSMCLAFILVFPTNLFAMGLDNTKNYTATASVMGLAANDDSGKENADQTLLASNVTSTQTDKYIIEKSAKLSKTTGKVDFMIKVFAKVNSTEDKLTTSFAISENTDLKDLKVEKVSRIDKTEEEIKYQEQRPSILQANHAFETLGVTTENEDLVYHLSAQLTDEALADIEDKSPTMALNFNIGADTQESYGLRIEKMEEVGESGQEPSQILKEDQIKQIKAIYKEKTSSLLGEKPAEITWTDYILPTEKTIYDIKLDQDQELFQVKIDFYQASEKGYVIKDEYSKTMESAQSLNLQIPQDQIARIEVRTKVTGNPKSFTYNNKEIPNPNFIDETENDKENKKETSEEDADPLPESSLKNETGANSSNDIISEDKDQDFSTNPSQEESQSAIALNKEAYLVKAENKEAVKQIAKVLEAYNNEESDFDQVKSSVESIAKENNLGVSQTEEIIRALISGLNEEKYKVATINPADLTVDIKEANDQTKLADDEIKELIKEEFAKKNSGQITEEELEQSLEQIRDENNIDKETFFNILADLYKNDFIETENLEEESIDTEKSKEEVLSEKLAEENLSTEDFIRFLQSYAKTYNIEENDLKAMLTENQDEVEKLIGDFTIDEILAAAYHEGLNPQILAVDENANITDAGISNERFITELEYFTETLTRATNEDKLFEIARSSNPNLSEQEIRNDYVGWKINIPGVDTSGMNISEIKDKKYDYNYMNFSVYAPAGQSLEDYKVVVEDGEGGKTTYSGAMTEKKGDHYIYGFSIPKSELTEKGYNIYVVAKAPKKRQNYAIGLKVAPDKNYVLSLKERAEEEFKKFSEKNPLLIKWIDTSAANPYANGIELLDTRMVYLEPKGWQDLFPYNGFVSVDYNDNVTDTDLMKNTVSMFGNIDESGQITWTISETFPAEKLENKNTVGRDAYSAKSDGQGLAGPNVQILVPNGAGYDAKNLGNISISELQRQIGNQPGTIVNYTYTQQAAKKEELTTLRLDSGKEASIADKRVLERDPGDIKDTTGLAYLHKVQEHNDGPGYEIALSNDQANTMKAFIPSNTSSNPRYKDPNFSLTGVVVFCLNPGKPEPTRQYKFNGTIKKGEWSTDKKDWAQNGRAIAALATASEAKASPLYKGSADDTFYASLYEHILRLYWYGQELAEEYQLDEQSYYKIIQYNLYYWIAGENYAENFKNGGGYNPNYFSSAEYSYAQELKQRISQGKDWGSVNYDEDIQIFYYGHDKTRSYQNTITGDTKRKKNKGSITVNKIDQDGKKLKGAAFQLLKEDQKTVIKTLVTDDTGVARFDNLDYGTYYLKEVQGPRGYKFSNEPSPVIVGGEEGAHVNFNATNTINEVEFRKLGADKLALEGVGFRLKKNGQLTSDEMVKSDSNGKFGWKGLTPGSYEVVEYDLGIHTDYSDNKGKTVASFRINSNNNIEAKTILSDFKNGESKDDIVNKKNEPKKGQIEFTKQDSASGKALEGAEFVLEYRKPGFTTYKTLDYTKKTTDSNGKISWKDLEAGDYRVIETKAPSKNYQTDINLGEKATFTVSSDGKTHTITNVNPSSKVITNETKPEEGEGSFEFEKIDEDTKEKLQGVEFTLESVGTVSDGKKEFVYKTSKTSDENGKIKFYKLLPGTYKLRETKPLAGYEANKNEWTVIVTKDRTTGAYTTKVLDSEGNDLTTSNSQFEIGPDKGLAYIGNYLGTVRANVEETDQQDVLDLNLSITPESEPYTSSNPVNIYYIYDSEESKQMIENLAENIDIKDKTVLKYGIKVSQDTVIDNDSRFTNQFYEIEKFINRYNTQNNIVVSAFTKSYNNIGLSDIRTMTEGRNNLALRGIPIFAYHKEAVTDPDFIDAVYNRNIYHFEDNYNPKIFDELKEVVDYINAGKSKLAGETIEFTTTSPVEVINGTTPNSHYINGLFLKANVSNNITLKIKVSDLNSLNDGSLLNDYLSLKATKNGTDLSSVIPDIKINKSGSSSSTPGSTGGSTGTGTSTGPAIIRQPITNKKKEPKPAKLTIKKVDGLSNEALDGAEFGLYESEADANSKTIDPIQTVTTDENGYAVFDSDKITENTKYYLKETKAPEGYMITDGGITEVSSSASADNKINAEIKNYKNNAKIDLYKKDDDDKYLEGVKFELKKTKSGTSQDGLMKVGETQVLTTDSYGHISYPLDVDSEYELIELRTLDGYQLNKSKATIKVDKEGNVTVEKNDLLTTEEGKEIVLETEMKETPLGAWKSAETTYTNPSENAYPSYMNTLDYAEYNPDTKEVTHYIMLKPDEDIGGKTDRATTLTLSSANAKIKSVSLYNADSGDIKASYRKAMQDRNIKLPSREATALNNNKNISIKMGTTSTDGNVRSSMTGLSTNSAYIKFPYDTGKKKGRFDANWAMLVKVVASVEDTKKVSSMSFNWTTDEAGQLSTSSRQEIPALVKEETIPGKIIKESPVMTVVNHKTPSIKFQKQDHANKNPLYGAEFILEKEGDQSPISITSSDKEGKFAFNNLADGSYKVFETVAPEGYPYLAKRVLVAEFTVGIGKVTTITTNKGFGNTRTVDPNQNETYVIYNKANEIKFKKINEDKEALKGAKFRLDRVEDKYVQGDDGKLEIKSTRETIINDIELDDKGLLSISARKPGRYQLIETVAPTGYQQIKTDNDEKGQIVAEFTVESGTLAIKNILVGDKYYQNTDEATQPIDIINKEVGKGKFQVNKVDDSNSPLNGARFLLKDINTNQYVMKDGSLTTNSAKALTDGATVNYENLPAGEYELREFKSPDGYVRTINTWKIVVARDGKTTIELKDKFDEGVEATISTETTDSPASLTLVNKSNEIEFTKIDSKTEKPLNGVEFEIWWDQQGDIDNRYGDTEESQYKNYVKIKNSNGLTTFTTDSEGKFKLSNLKTGHYKIYETKIPDGYKVTDQPTDNEPIKDAKGEFVNEFYVDIDGDIKKNDNGIVGGEDDVLVTTIKNTPITGKFRVQKVGDDGVEKLDGAEFALYKVDENGNKEGKAIKPLAIDGVTGLVEFSDLIDGDYLLEETKAPNGYNISSAKWNVTVTDGKVNISSTNGSADFSRTDDTITLNVVNKKASLPITGGTGTKIAFALIGTAVMITAIAYFGMLTSNKNRRRSRR